MSSSSSSFIGVYLFLLLLLLNIINIGWWWWLRIHCTPTRIKNLMIKWGWGWWKWKVSPNKTNKTKQNIHLDIIILLDKIREEEFIIDYTHTLFSYFKFIYSKIFKMIQWTKPKPKTRNENKVFFLLIYLFYIFKKRIFTLFVCFVHLYLRSLNSG